MAKTRIDSRRIKRMRAPPRIISIAGDIGEDTPMENKSDLIITKEEIPIEPIHPHVVSSVTMRPEYSAPNSIRTSVLTYPDESSIRRVSPPIVKNNEFWNNSKLIRPKAADKTRSPQMQTFDRDPVYVRDPAQLRLMTEQLQSEVGLQCKPGQTILVEILGRRNRSNPMNYTIEGTQAIRISIMDGSGGLLEDIEIPPHSLPTELRSLPQKAAFLALTGLGGNPDVLKSIEPSSGAVTLSCSTDDTAAIGFHPPNRLVQIISGSYLCRGGTILTDGSGDETQPWITAENGMTLATMVNLQMSSSIDTVIVITEENAQPTITSSGVDVSGPCHVVQGDQVTATLWPVSKMDEGGEICNIIVQTPERSKIHSVLAMRGGIENWIHTMETSDWSTIVEEGALSNHGMATIRILGAESDGEISKTSSSRSSKNTKSTGSKGGK